MPSDNGRLKSHTARDPGSSYYHHHLHNDRDETTLNRSQYQLSEGLQPSRHYVENEYPVAQLDSWPLTSRATYKRPFAGGGGAMMVSSPSSPEKKHLSTGAPDSSTQILRINHDFTTSSSSSLSFTSPISPRQRKAHQRHALLDESKSKPLLLQELQAFVDSELAELAQQQRNDGSTEQGDPSHSRIQDTTQSSLQRLQVFREVFERVITAFSVYAPMLSQVQSEYERVVTKLRAQCLQIPKLHSQLQTLQTKCVHELSAHALESKLRSQALKKQLKGTQGKLTALAAQNALLTEQNAKLQAQIEKLEQRGAEMQLSNHSLMNGMKRHDDTLHHIHERSREEGMALQQMNSKYHHACEEIAELKKTIATLEEKVGGVHVAADKATIALLTKDIQEMHAKLQEVTNSASVNAVAELQQGLAQHTALSHAFIKVLEAQGVAVNYHELLAVLLKSSTNGNLEPGVGLSSRPGLSPMPPSSSGSGALASRPTATTAVAGSEYAEATEAVATWVLDKVLTQTRAREERKNYTGMASTAGVGTGASATFLTEPEETLSLESASAFLSSTRTLSAPNDFFTGKGFGTDVPEYLQCDGLVRNLHFPKKKLEAILARVWQQKDDLEKIKRNHFASISSASSPGTATSGAPSSPPLGLAPGAQQGGGIVTLAKVFSMMLNRMCASKAEATESAYNVLAALELFSSHSSDCRLFLMILQSEIPEEARQDQVKEVYIVHDALASLEKERNSSGGGGAVVPGRVPLADVIQILRHVFPWKTENALSALYRALLIDQRGHAQVDYAALLLQQEDKRAGVRAKTSQFVECLRAQYIDDLLAYRRHLQAMIQHKLASSTQATSASGDAAAQGTLGSEVTSTVPESAVPSSPQSSAGSTIASSSSAMVSIRALRDFLQECDVAKPVQEINRLLATASGLSMDQVLTQDAMMLNAQQFLRKLPTLLVKPTGKFQSGGSSAVATSTATTRPAGSLH